MSNVFNYNIRVYYEDTDAMGVVYYANYLKFAERARTEMLRKKNINQMQLREKDDIIFVVRKADISFSKPARFDDMLLITSEIIELKPASIILEQNIFKDNQLLVKLNIIIASINSSFKPIPINKNLRNALLL